MDNMTFSMLHGINEIKIIEIIELAHVKKPKKKKPKQINKQKTSILLEKVIQFEQTTSISC